MWRYAVLSAGLMASFPAFAEDMKAEEARRFVVGKLYSFTCFEGTRGSGRINADGSVYGTVQFGGKGPVRWANLPADTLRVKGEAICATVKGLFFEPCFNVQKINAYSFRGSISGLGFASCEFTRRARVETASWSLRTRSAQAAPAPRD